VIVTATNCETEKTPTNMADIVPRKVAVCYVRKIQDDEFW
jgi:hypothetical protein